MKTSSIISVCLALGFSLSASAEQDLAPESKPPHTRLLIEENDHGDQWRIEGDQINYDEGSNRCIYQGNVLISIPKSTTFQSSSAQTKLSEDSQMRLDGDVRISIGKDILLADSVTLSPGDRTLVYADAVEVSDCKRL